MENILPLDLHALVPRFAALRLRDAARLGRLITSIEQQGQLTAVVVVPDAEDAQRWVLIDGYRRLEALQRLGRDLILAHVWERSVDEALLGCLARGPDRGWEAIEEAALIEELAGRHSQQTIARRIGRDVSWVSRRLSLIKVLPEDLLEQVRRGRVSVWAATRVLAPLARANSDHARTLLKHIEQQPLSTRALKRLYEQYRKATKVQRQRLVENPALFLQALDNREQQVADKRLAAGPEGAWCKDLAAVGAIAKRLLPCVPTLFAPQQDRLECERLRQAFAAAKTPFQRLEQALVEVADPDRRGAPPSDSTNARGGCRS
jgi:ParB/RepB/Spo0J family partition protein